MSGKGKPTRVDAIVEEVKREIARGAYAIGDRLPPVRAAALHHGASKNTVAEAYDRLVSEGSCVRSGGRGIMRHSGAADYAPRRLRISSRPPMPSLCCGSSSTRNWRFDPATDVPRPLGWSRPRCGGTSPPFGVAERWTSAMAARKGSRPCASGYNRCCRSG
ncbi:winged helix-turn-helix domain-containing protein [Aureimonas altamirensis]|uniref:GntR family transcriptional regulator n=1 Tax=Aureimonas altamirensis TaxID=370622 RepID=UPI001E38476E|nr:winged helix-turn-helix domain-containing protein [Aureimonas altamirensis]UHD45791.1 winged helix-turn-helix domain-containing protein [Aureimonas altamirensis]